MFHSPLNAGGNCISTTVTAGIQALDAHQSGIGSHACLRARRTVAADRTRAVRAVTVVVHGVVVVVLHVVTVMRELGTTVPEMIGQVEVVVVNTRINHGHHNPFARIAQGPHLIGLDLRHVRGDFTRSGSGLGHFAIWNPIAFDSIAYHLNIRTSGKVLHCCFSSRKRESVGHPKYGRLGRHAVALHLRQRVTQIIL